VVCLTSLMVQKIEGLLAADSISDSIERSIRVKRARIASGVCFD